MTGILHVLLAATNGRLTGAGGSAINTAIVTGIRSATFALVNDGTFTGTGSGGGSWWTPTTAGVGSQWSAKAVINSQTNTTASGTYNSFVSLSSGTSWNFSNTLSNNEGQGTMTISFSPDGGTTTAGTMTVTWDVGYTP